MSATRVVSFPTPPTPFSQWPIAEFSHQLNTGNDPNETIDIHIGHTIVTVLCDYGTRYQSRLFNPKFLREKGLPVPPWLDQGQAAAPCVFV